MSRRTTRYWKWNGRRHGRRKTRASQAIVAHAPLEYGERCRAYLDALVGISPFVKGIRRLLQGEADPEFCLRPDFVRGVKLPAGLRPLL